MHIYPITYLSHATCLPAKHVRPPFICVLMIHLYSSFVCLLVVCIYSCYRMHYTPSLIFICVCFVNTLLYVDFVKIIVPAEYASSLYGIIHTVIKVVI